MKLTKEDIDKVRHIEGFPIGSDEDIISLSKPPHYTICPNPFIDDFIKKYGNVYDELKDDYSIEPFAADVSEGKADSIYMAHSYHTKVPHKAIMRYILHYTEPGDIVFDGFSGTGMTGVAAKMCGMPDLDPDFKYVLEKELDDLKWGTRYAILNDISPAASFITYNYNKPSSTDEFIETATKILNDLREELSWLYETEHNNDSNQLVIESDKRVGQINFVVWSDVYVCPTCSSDIVFWDAAVKGKKILNEFDCQVCNTKLKKKDCDRSKELKFNTELNKELLVSKQVPVQINYSYAGKRYTKKPDSNDLKLITSIEESYSNYWYPTDSMPVGANTNQPKNSHGVTNVNLMYTKRNLVALSKFYESIKEEGFNYLFTSIIPNSTKMYKYRTDGKGGIVTGTLYIPALCQENNVFNLIENKMKAIAKGIKDSKASNSIVSCNSSTDEPIPTNSIDYIFTDPPFGENINYSELSFLWESWLKVKTNNRQEAIMNRFQSKGLLEYQQLMTQCFEEFFRILKPNRWMTVEFHNSKNSVWNAIQESLNRAGFIIADVRTLDKKQGSFKQVTTTSAVKQDLVISAYKPREILIRRIKEHIGTEDTVWDFINEHLSKLPVLSKNFKSLEMIKERQAFLLFDRMIAYHIVNGFPVPIDAADFYRKLDDRYYERDSMYFLEEQVPEYDKVRHELNVEPIQLSLIITDEKTALAWLYNELSTPQTYAEIQPKFIVELKTAKFEKMPELMIILEENFLKDANGKWYIPDPKDSGDLIKLREKRLLKEFDEYTNGKGKLKVFRTEAIRVGFAKLWKDKNYQGIVNVANRIPEKVIQEDDKLLMYYDISLSRVE